MAQGVSNSPRNFSHIVRAFVRSLVNKFSSLFTKDKKTKLFSYIDDIFGGHDSYELAIMQQILVIFMATLLGIELHPEKLNFPASVQTILGVRLNAKTKILEINPKNIQKFMKACELLLNISDC